MATAAHQWLHGNRDYNAGLELLRTAGISSFKLDLLSSGPDHYNTPLLHREIEKLAKTEPLAAPAPVVQLTSRPEPVPVKIEVDLPAAVTPLNTDLEKKLRIDHLIKNIWKEICHLHGQLSVVPEGEELHQVSRSLMLKKFKMQRLWDELHYFNNNGHWFDELPENKPKPENIDQAIKNARSNRAKASKKLKDPLPAAMKAFYEAKVTEWDKKIDDLTRLKDGKAPGVERAA